MLVPAAGDHGVPEAAPAEIGGADRPRVHGQIGRPIGGRGARPINGGVEEDPGPPLPLGSVSLDDLQHERARAS